MSKPFQIIVAEPHGFCFGVRRAVQRAIELARDSHAEEIVTYGPLIHNDLVVEHLKSIGIKPVESLEELRGKYVLIRTHGASPEDIDTARQQGKAVEDLTCPIVARVQQRAKLLGDEGYQVVIIGDPNHPEVVAINAWTGNNATVISEPSQVDSYQARDKPVGIVVQTTQTPEKVDAILNKFRARGLEVRLENTLCKAITRRQQETRQIARKSDVVLVVGSRHSSNTQKLVSVCQEEGTEVHLVQNAKEIDPRWFEGKERVGITGGASTPDWAIKEVIEKMEEIKQQTAIKEVEKGEVSTNLPQAASSAAVGSSTDAEVGTAIHEELTESTERVVESEGPDQKPPEDGPKAKPQGEGEVQPLEVPPINVGEILKGKVVSITPDSVLVDVGYKSEGEIPIGELSHRFIQSPQEVVKQGDEIEVYVTEVDEPEGVLKLSKRRADEERAWERLYKAHETNQTITAPVIEEVKGGLIVDVGIKAFMPASHVERGYVSDLSKYVGQQVRARVIELDRSKNRAILSQKVVLEEEYQKLRANTLASIKEGDVLTGIVKSVTDFGAFIDVGGIDGLLHVSEMSWSRINHPSEVVKEGETLKVVVLKVDREKEKISLGLKQILPDPWEGVEQRFKENTVVKGKVVRTVGFGAFVELEPGIEGLIHISQLANRRVASPDEVVKPGDEVFVKVLKVNPKERRISLSLKDAEAPSKEEGAHRTPAQNQGTVTLGDVVGEALQETKERISQSSDR